jgi:hypothetical protein
VATPTDVNTVWQMTFRYAMNGQILLNTFHYVQKTSSVADYVAYAIAFNSQIVALGALKDKIKDVLCNTCQLTNIIYQPIKPIRYQAVVAVVGENGTMLGDPLPQNVGQTIERRGIVANRHNMGSLHLPPPSVAGVSGGLLTGIQITNLNIVAAALLLVIAPPLTPAVMVPYLIPRDPDSPYVPLASAAAQTTVRVLRRRTVGVGK